jgi:nicotinate-nucleotide adenylyltransferase
VTQTSRTGVLGGTFDPIHVGHLAVASEARRALALDEVLFLPLRVPAHRPTEPVASPEDRLAMATLAARASGEAFRASDIELTHPGPSYTADTLRALHAAGYEAWQLFFLTGADAFADISTWREYPALLDLAHFVACARPGWPVAALPDRVPALAKRMTSVTATTPYRVTPSHEKGQTRVFLLDLVTPDVASTTIRARARAGLPIADLVPPEVDHYIHRHGLYRTPSVPGSAGRSAVNHLHE